MYPLQDLFQVYGTYGGNEEMEIGWTALPLFLTILKTSQQYMHNDLLKSHSKSACQMAI